MANDCHNMVSNLPLLFAGGYPTSLDKISVSQLEQFIPFMVQCSLGNIQIHNNTEYSEPEWWPENVPFSIPLQRPAFETEWHDNLKSIVIICYKFHKSIFLLRFCQQLATYQPESLRFINNYNNTTSLFERASNKLLVTFRNENMLYDQAAGNKSGKITLLSSRKMNSQSKIVEEAVDTVETVFEIYLCDNCEAELYSKDAYDEHEKTCQEDDDVIFCGEEFLTNPMDDQLKEQSLFLQNFSLGNRKMPLLPNQMKTPTKKSNTELSSTSGKHRRKPRCSQIVLSTSIPFSSPAGQQLLKLSKSLLAPSYIHEKLERVERYCSAPPLTNDSSANSLPIKSVRYNRIPVTYRQPADHSYRRYQFPRRQYSLSWHQKAFLNLNCSKLKLCLPVSVKLKRLTHSDIEAFHAENSNKKMAKLGNVVKAEFVTFDATKPVTVVDDVIDLCSDEDDGDSEFVARRNDNVRQLRPDISNVSQMATTPTTKLTVNEPMDTQPFEMYTETRSSQAMFSNLDAEKYSYHSHENHQSFLNGAQSSIVRQIDKLTELTISSKSQAHISIDLTL